MRKINNYRIIDIDESPIEWVIDRIISYNNGLKEFWGSAHGWASDDAADLLAKSRLDWQVELSYCLKTWVPEGNISGYLILSWANLGSLVEGYLKTFLSIYYEDYKAHRDRDGMVKKYQKSPDMLPFDDIIKLFNRSIWIDEEKHWNKWLEHIQQRRNAIHAYRNREIGNFQELYKDIRAFLKLMDELDTRIIYPDGLYSEYHRDAIAVRGRGYNHIEY